MLLSSCCLASSATQDGSQHCDYLCIFKHGTLCFLKGLMYSWEAGWLPSPRPLRQGPRRCQLRTSHTSSKAEVASGRINLCPALPKNCEFPRPLRPPSPPRWAALRTGGSVSSVCFYPGIAPFSGFWLRGRSVLVRASLRARAHGHRSGEHARRHTGKTASGVRNPLAGLLPVLG